MNKDDRVYIGHIVDAVERVEMYIQGYTNETFKEDDKTIAAVVRELEIIGEATKKLSNDFLKAHSDIPAEDMIGMRNRLIHEYFGVTVDIVWDTCKEDLPSLLALMKGILKE